MLAANGKYEFQETAIEITHIESPHTFWFRYKTAPSDAFQHFENSLEKFSIERLENVSFIQTRRGISVNDIVSVFHNDKWLRCRVTSIEKSLYFVWSIDYGFPLKIPKIYLILIYDEKLANETFSSVFKGGLSTILPIEEVIFRYFFIFFF